MGGRERGGQRIQWGSKQDLRLRESSLAANLRRVTSMNEGYWVM